MLQTAITKLNLVILDSWYKNIKRYRYSSKSIINLDRRKCDHATPARAIALSNKLLTQYYI